MTKITKERTPGRASGLSESQDHHQISRRQFLGKAAKYTIGGMTAVAGLDSLVPDRTSAQPYVSENLPLAEESMTDFLLPIRLFGDPALRQQTMPVTSVNVELKELIEDMMETMHNAGGIGLAAPQVGRPERLFVVDISSPMRYMPEGMRSILPEQPMVLINPEIAWQSESKEEFPEGCLSIPHVGIPVIRPKFVEVRYQDELMKKHSLHADGILARVIQHEYDHLEGILITDHINGFSQNSLRKLSEVARGNVQTDFPVLSAF